MRLRRRESLGFLATCSGLRLYFQAIAPPQKSSCPLECRGVLIAGATGAIGKSLLSCLDDAGHELFELVRSPIAAILEGKGATEIVADALDAASVLEAVQHIKPDVIINELTSCRNTRPGDEGRRCARQRSAGEGQCKPVGRRAPRIAAMFCNPPPSGTRPDQGWPMKPPPFAFDASPGIAAGCRTYADLEEAAQGSGLLPTAKAAHPRARVPDTS
jgi:hypothetical protein